MLRRAAKSPRVIRQTQAYATIGLGGPQIGGMLNDLFQLGLEGNSLLGFCGVVGIAVQFLLPDVAERVKGDR